jgi:hypothetical protein
MPGQHASRIQGHSTHPAVREPTVLVIGPRNTIVAASPEGKKFVEKAAAWVAQKVKTRDASVTLRRAVSEVLTGKSQAERIDNMIRPANGDGNSTSLWVLPAYRGGDGDIVGAMIVEIPSTSNGESSAGRNGKASSSNGKRIR